MEQVDYKYIAPFALLAVFFAAQAGAATQALLSVTL